MRRSKELDSKRGLSLQRAVLRRIGHLLDRWSNALLGEERDDRRSADSPKTLSVQSDEPAQGMTRPVQARPPADWLARVTPHPPPADWLAQVQGKIFVSRTVHQPDEMVAVSQTPSTSEAHQTILTLPPQAVADNSLPRSEEPTRDPRDSYAASRNPAQSVPEIAGTTLPHSVSREAGGTQSVQSYEMTNGLVPASSSSFDGVPIEPAAQTFQTPLMESSHVRVEPAVEDVVSERPGDASPDGVAAEPISQRAQIHRLPMPPVIQSDRVEPAVPDEDFPLAWAGLLTFAGTPKNSVTKPFAAQPLTEFPSVRASLEQEISTRLDTFVPERGHVSEGRDPAQVIVQTESVWVAPREGWVPLPNDEGETQDSEQARREWERRVRIDREQRGS